MIPEELRIAIPVVVPAMIASAAAIILGCRLWRRAAPGPLWNGSWAGPLALGAAFIFAFGQSAGWANIWPNERWQWIAPMAGAAMVVGIVSGMARPRAWLIKFMYAMIAAAAGGALLQPTAGAGNPIVWKIGLGIAAIVTWLALEPIAGQRGGLQRIALPAGLCIAFGAASMLLVESGFAKLSLSAAGASAACGIMLLAALWRVRVSFEHGTAIVAAVLLPAIAIIGWFYRDESVPAGSFVLIAASPLMMALGLLPPVRRWRPWPIAAVQVIGVAAVAGAGLLLARGS